MANVRVESKKHIMYFQTGAGILQCPETADKSPVILFIDCLCEHLVFA